MMQKSVLFLLFANSLVFSQTTYTITGTVVDDQRRPIAMADVLLYPKEGDTLIKYTTVYDGVFSLEAPADKFYRLKISCLGFGPVTQTIFLTRDLHLTLALAPNATDLEEVEVVAARPMVTNTNGNLKVDVTNPVFSSIPDPMELLARLPSLQVGPDGETLTVIGKGSPLIYMGNQRISLNEFTALSVDDISSIEIIRNPSAKYEAEGRAVLLVTRRRNDTEGTKLDLSETLSIKRNFSNYSGFNLNLKKKKMTLKANLAYNQLQTWESNGFRFEIPDRDIFSDYLILLDRNDRVQINTGLGLFYEINEYDYFSLNGNRKWQGDDFKIGTDTFFKQGPEEDHILSETFNDNSKDFANLNFNFNKRLGSNLNVFTGLQYSSYVQKLATEIFNNYNETEFVHDQGRQQKYRIAVWAYRFDIEKELKHNMKLEMGATFSHARANALSDFRYINPPSNKGLDYDYRERTVAAYSQLAGSMGKKVSFNAGLRLENNVVWGEEVGQDGPLVDRESTVLFPKAVMDIKIDSLKTLTFNYAKSINRPNYSNASSISVFFNPFLEGQGNLNLLPTLTQEISANFQFKDNSLSLQYTNRDNPIYYTIGYTEGDDKAVFSLKNLERESSWELNLTVPISKGIWTATNRASLVAIQLRDKTAPSTPISPYLYLYTDHQFKVAHNMTFSLGGWTRTGYSEGIFKRNGLLAFNAAITKTFFDRLHCSLRFNDIGRGLTFRERYSINGVNSNGVYYTDVREMAFSLKYSLGRIKEPAYKNRDIDENLERIQ